MKKTSETSIKWFNNNKPPNSYLTIIGKTRIKNKICLMFLCACGKTGTVCRHNFLTGKIKSCGCRKKKGLWRKYSQFIKGIYQSWYAMTQRCYNKNHVGYKSYGARGVVVCEEWLGNYESFLKWALQNEWKEGLEIDKDIKGDGFIYSPTTCCWVTRKENLSARKPDMNIKNYVFYNGDKISISDFCKRFEIPFDKARMRIIKLKWPLEDVIKYKDTKFPCRFASK